MESFSPGSTVPNHTTFYHITSALVLEGPEQTLTQLVSAPGFDELDRSSFSDGIGSAIEHLHSLGLANNDLNPNNIMVRRGMDGEIMLMII